MGLKPEAGRAERGRGADSESESESEADEGGPREPARELQSKFREAPSGWLCRNDPGSDWVLGLICMALAGHWHWPAIRVCWRDRAWLTVGQPRPQPLLQQRIVQQPDCAWADHGARVPTHDNTRAIAAFQVCHGLAPMAPGPGLARVTRSRTQTRNLNLKP